MDLVVNNGIHKATIKGLNSTYMDLVEKEGTWKTYHEKFKFHLHGFSL